MVELTGITVRDFRNIAGLDITLPADGVVIIGENGQGKTNLLEAVYYLVLFRSLRGAKDRELVRFGQPGFFVAGSAGVRIAAGYEVVGKRKKVTLDGAPVKQLGAAVGQLVAVSFSPADRAIVAGGPSARRRYLDVLLALSLPGYLDRLTKLRAALRQRNAALRRGQAKAAQAFDGPFASAGHEIALARRQWVEQWASRFADICKDLGERAESRMRYDMHGRAAEADTDLRKLLSDSLDRDLRRGMTTTGPHRDDLRLTLGDHDLRAFGSAGQQRTAAIGLRLLEAETLTRVTGQAPLAMYDDVFAELDQERQARLLTLIQDTLPGQSIITAPRDSEVPAALLRRPRWTMTGGTVAQ